jgi:SAM-dependent methyltransferase
MELLLAHSDVELVETDVHLGPRTALVCDAHDLPFEDGSFDAVTIAAVLEHVTDPGRCVEEVYRVLGPNGLVYADTPFMQQVHGGCYDFTRFTELGHRRLFRRFEAIASGVNGGPGMALAWAHQYFLVSFASSRRLRQMLTLLARFSSFWLLYFDRYLRRKPGAFDAASSFYFLGRKSSRTLSDRELIGLYRGAS